jgi:hypothetical protein
VVSRRAIYCSSKIKVRRHSKPLQLTMKRLRLEKQKRIVNLEQDLPGFPSEEKRPVVEAPKIIETTFADLVLD